MMFFRTLEPGRSRRLAALCLEEDRFALAVGRARGERLEKLDFIEETPSVGLRGGMITDADLFVDALDRLAASLEQVTSSQRLDRIVCGIHGPFIGIQYVTRSFKIPPGPPLGAPQVRGLLRDTALKDKDTSDRVLLNVIPWRYVLDDYRESDNPVGLRADRLTVQALGVYADRPPFADFQDAFEELGLDGAELTLTSVAAARAALTEDERSDGVVLLEFAWDGCRVSLYSRGRLYLHQTTDIGLSELAQELALTAPMTPQEARRLMPELRVDGEGDGLFAPPMTRFLSEVLRDARHLIQESLSAMEYPPPVMSWVLAGSVADAAGVTGWTAEEIQLPVRRARPAPEFRIAGYDHSGVVGLLGLLDSAAAEPGPASVPMRTRVIDRARAIPRGVWQRLRSAPPSDEP